MSTSLQQNNQMQLSLAPPPEHEKPSQRQPLLDHLFAQLGEEFSFLKTESPELKQQRSRIFSDNVIYEAGGPRARICETKKLEIDVDFLDRSVDETTSVDNIIQSANSQDFDTSHDCRLNVNVLPFKPPPVSSAHDHCSSTNVFQCNVTQADSEETLDDIDVQFYANINSNDQQQISTAFEDNASFASFHSAQSSFKQKEKTEICKNWLIDRCKFGDQCSFAHGYDQIQKKSHMNDKYKLTRCKGFHEHGYCPYGARCQFAHISRENVNSWRHALEQNTLQFLARTESVADPNYQCEFNVAASGFKRLSFFEKLVKGEGNDKKAADSSTLKVSKGRNQFKKRSNTGKAKNAAK